jgi:hypothetical protein
VWLGETESTWYEATAAVSLLDPGMKIVESKYTRRKPASMSLCATDPTWPELGLNLSHSSGKPVTNHLSYGTANHSPFVAIPYSPVIHDIRGRCSGLTWRRINKDPSSTQLFPLNLFEKSNLVRKRHPRGRGDIITLLPLRKIATVQDSYYRRLILVFSSRTDFMCWVQRNSSNGSSRKRKPV